MSNENENQAVDNMPCKWIARDGDGELDIYEKEPIFDDELDLYDNQPASRYWHIDDNLFPELKPREKCRIECSIKLKGEPVKP